MPSIGWIHTLTALAALATGALVLLTRKGTRRHRRMVGGVGPFHVAAVLSLATVVAGAVSAVRARKARVTGDGAARAKYMGHHYQWMSWSYVGLLAAAVSEIATRVPALRPQPGHGAAFGTTVAIATILVVGIGRHLIRGRQVALLLPFQRAAN